MYVQIMISDLKHTVFDYASLPFSCLYCEVSPKCRGEGIYMRRSYGAVFQHITDRFALWGSISADLRPLADFRPFDLICETVGNMLKSLLPHRAVRLQHTLLGTVD